MSTRGDYGRKIRMQNRRNAPLFGCVFALVRMAIQLAVVVFFVLAPVAFKYWYAALLVLGLGLVFSWAGGGSPAIAVIGVVLAASGGAYLAYRAIVPKTTAGESLAQSGTVLREPIPARLRFEILRRDGFRCTYCGRGEEDGVELEVDHVVPGALGGHTERDNLVTACAECNRGKGATSLVGVDPSR